MKKRTMTSVVLLGTLLGSVWLWGGGCDITRIEEEEQVDVESIALVEELLASLSNADTYAKSEAAINTVLEMTGDGMPESPDPYGRYVLTDEARSSLAQAHVRFVKGELAPEPSLGNSYEKISSAGPPITTDLNETLEILAELANYALAEPLDPGNVLLIVIATEGSTLPYFFDDQRPGRALSPVQEFLFEVWLQEHGPSMEIYADDARKKPKLTCPAQSDFHKISNGCTGNIDKKVVICHVPPKKFDLTLCVSINAVDGHLRHGDECFACGHDQGGGD